MKEYKFEEKKLYKFEGGCLYIVKRKKRSIRCVLILKGTELLLINKTLEIDNHTAIELTFKIDTAMNAEYVAVMGYNISSDCLTDNYKCPLLFTGISRYRLKEMKAAGVEMEWVLMDVDI